MAHYTLSNYYKTQLLLIIVELQCVVDFDVHQSNGTEAGFIFNDQLFFGSTLQRGGYPYGCGNDPSPRIGNAAKDPLHRRIINRQIPGDQPSRDAFHRAWLLNCDLLIRRWF